MAELLDQMADMVTARDLLLEGVKLLAVSYQVRIGSLHYFLVVSNRIVMFLLHRFSLGLWVSFLFRIGRSQAA